MIRANVFWTQSLLLHLALLLAIWITVIPRGSSPVVQDFEVYEQPKVVSNPKPIQLREEPRKAPPERRAVFGASRKAITSPEGSIDVKQGNTVAKTPDQETLRPEDADSLPIPAEEYLVSAMPVLDREYRIPYPAQAKKAGVEGPVLMDLLIDAEGSVRQVTLISGPGAGLDEAAAQAVKGFRFKPARVKDRAVAVRIRYAYRFVLER